MPCYRADRTGVQDVRPGQCNVKSIFALHRIASFSRDSGCSACQIELHDSPYCGLGLGLNLSLNLNLSLCVGIRIYIGVGSPEVLPTVTDAEVATLHQAMRD